MRFPSGQVIDRTSYQTLHTHMQVNKSSRYAGRHTLIGDASFQERLADDVVIFVGDQLRGGAVGSRLPEHQTLSIEGFCGRRDLAAWRQRIAAKTNRAALADMVLETEFGKPRRDRRHKRVKGNCSGRESCSNLYRAATVSVLDPGSRLEATCPDSSLVRLLTAAFSNSVASVARDPAAGAGMESSAGSSRSHLETGTM